MDTEEQKKLLDRLARIEGQIGGLRRMLEDDRACEDVLTQLLAARSGLEKAGLVILDRHMEKCVLGDDAVGENTLIQLREALRLWAR
jgi:DNA-binding FrmR family transcriptional regulator